MLGFFGFYPAIMTGRLEAPSIVALILWPVSVTWVMVAYRRVRRDAHLRAGPFTNG